MKTKTISRFNAFLMLTVILFWGSSFVVVKIALSEGLTPIALATFRFLVAGGLFLLMLPFQKSGMSHQVVLAKPKDVVILLFLALTGVTFFFTAQYTGIEMAGASIAAILVCLLSPVLISVLSALLLRERLTKKQVIGIGTAAIGTFIVIMSRSASFQENQDFLYGSLILLSTPFLWAAYTLVGKKMMDRYDPFLIVAYVNILGGLCLIPFSLAEGSLHLILTMSLNGWLTVLFLSVTCSLLCYYIWFYVVCHAGATVTSSFLFAEPLITVIFAVTFVGEQVSPFVSLGGFLIFIGVLLVTRK